MTGSSDERHDQPESAENWPPDGCGHTQEIPNVHWWIPIGIAVVVAIPLFMILLLSIGQFADPWVADLRLLLDRADTPARGLSIILRSVTGILAALLVVVTLTYVVHEPVHYITNWGMGLTPEFCWARSKFLKNPAVIAVDVGTTRLQNATAALSPFFIIGMTGLLAWWYLDGFLAAVAGIIVLVNCPASGKDLYSAYWLARLPSGTKFATFKIESGYHSEYTVPASTNGRKHEQEGRVTRKI